MKNRSHYAVLTRFGIIGAVIAALLLIAPAATAQQVINPMEVDYPEGDNTMPVGTYLAVDPEGADITWGVGGDDASSFSISAEGVLTFNDAPDFETKPSYTVDIMANMATVLPGVTVTITNVQEPGTVTLDQPQPEVGVMVGASVEDDDIVDDATVTVMWQWARSADMVTWEDIADAEMENYTPVIADVGMYLRATATYDDAAPPDDDDATKDMNEGLVSTAGDTGISERMVRGSPAANARPLFPDENEPAGADPITIDIDENTTGAIGERVVAMDGDNDVRLYSLTETEPRTVAVDEDDKARFEINERTGQISVTEGTVLNANTDTEIDNGNNEASYEVTVTATDPSLATGTVTVTINVADVDETPTGLQVMDSNDDGTDNQNPTELTIDENTRTLEAPTASSLTYVAADPDQGVTLEWSLSGADAASFEIDETSGTLSYHTETDTTEADYVAPPNHEAKAEYSITIEVKGGEDSTMPSTLDVTIKVDDVAEDGTVMLSARQPHVGKAVTAELDEDDDGETSIQWRWGTVADAPNIEATACTDATFEDEDNDPKAPSASYMPVAADDGMRLCAQASYFDDAEPAGDDPDTATRDTSVGISEAVIEVRPTSNSAPTFPDEDTDGTADPVMVEEAENDGGTVGEEAITATDNNNDPDDHADLLLYSLEGPDKDSFTVEERGANGGQISVADGVTLDFENPSDMGGTAGDNMYVVMVKATDPSGSSDMVEVTISVTGVEEMPMAPEGVTNPAEVDYPEGDNTDPVGTYAAVDPEGDDIMWDVGGTDASAFSIDAASGVLTLNDAPDFEAKPSYSVDVEANDMKLLTVTVTITNVQEPGTVTLDQPQPQVGQAVVASVEDDDIVDAAAVTVMWQWAKSADMVTWEDIEDAELEDYTPVIADVGMYLRATASYDDPAPPDDDPETKDMNEGLVSTAEDTGISEEAVEGSPAANAAPMFAPDVDHDDDDQTDNIYQIMIDENSTGEIGDAITATDADVDVRLYSLGPTLNDQNQPDNDADHMLFTVNARSGRISVGDDTTLNFETPSDADTNNTYELDIIATDPSGATGRATVNIVVADVDEPPTGLDDDANPTELTIDENTRELEAPTDSDLTYAAEDPDANVDEMWSVSGADAASFEIDETSGTLSYHTETDTTEADYVAPPNHEAKAEYSITIEVKGGADSDVKDTLDVTIKVDDVAEAGTAMVSARQPHVGKSVTAELDEMDDNPTSIQWRWGTVDGTSQLSDCEAATVYQDEDNQTKAPSASYTPVAADDGMLLCAQASYFDDAEPAGDDPDTATRDTSVGISEAVIEVRPTSNGKPMFPDEDTDGTADPVMIEEAENDGGTVGEEAITAMDNNNDPDDHTDLLLYSLEGPDKDLFTVEERGDNGGQISVADGVTLDYENPTDTGGTAGDNEYVVIVMAHDPSGAYDMVEVTIKVTPVDEPPVLSMQPAENTAPAFADDAATDFMVYENMDAGAAVGTVTASDDDVGDTLTYSDNSGYFDVDEMGNITTTMTLDHEAMASHSVTITATDSEGATDTLDVTIMVGDAHPDCPDMGLTNDCEALLDAKSDLGGDLNWDADTAMADWEGVTMSDGRVSGIWLKDEGLDGSVSAALGRLDMLTVLNLHTNSLSGEIPDLSGASMLEELYLPNNDLTGGIPEWLNGSTNLTELWLWGNQLTGSVPDLSGLTNLDKLKLANNMLDGGLPTADMLPPNVTWLIIDRNPFGGDIPDLSSLSRLELLWLHSSELTGSVPSGGMLPASLDDLNLRDNMLMGAIPDLSALDNLTRLRLHNNSLSGAVPGSLGGLDSLTSLWLHNEMDDEGMLIGNNMFTSIEDGVGDLDDTLTHMYVNGNSFADGTCLPGDLASVANNDFEAAGLVACADDGS